MLNQIGNYSSLLCVGAPQGARLPVLLICIIKKLYIEVMGGCANLACQATPNFFFLGFQLSTTYAPKFQLRSYVAQVNSVAILILLCSGQLEEQSWDF
jgi:hypothetical protein